MKTRFSKGLVVLLIFVLTFSLLAACTSDNSSNGGNSGGSTNSDGKDSGGSSDNGDGGGAKVVDGKFSEPVTLNVVLADDEEFREGESLNDNVWTRYVKEKFNVNLNYLWRAHGDAYEQKIRLELSANNKLPDVLLVTDKVLASELIRSGKFLEVGDLWEQYAGPTWKEAMESQLPEVFYPYKLDGKLMAIPRIEYAMHHEATMHIREDWLKKFNLKAPTTISELETVMDKFVNGDPDGNGQKDTWGLVMDIDDSFDWPAQGAIDWLFGAYGTLPNQWHDYDGDGKVESGDIQPGAKQALAKLNEWWSKGYLPKEVGVWDPEKVEEAFASGKAGIAFSSRWFAGGLEDVEENVEGAILTAYPNPVGPDGTGMRIGYPGNDGAYLINKDAEHPEAFFVIQNYLIENYATNKKGSEFEKGMFEGYDYVIKPDGTWSEEDEDFPSGNRVRPYKYAFSPNGARLPNLRNEALLKFYNGGKPENPFEEYVYNDNSAQDIETAAVIYQTRDLRKINKFNGVPTETMVSRKGFLDKMMLETYHKIIYGRQPVDSFDQFVKDWKSNGGDKITEEVNAWLESVQE